MLIDDDTMPWIVAEGDAELERELGGAVRAQVTNSRESAHNSRNKAGVYQGAGQQRVLSVKLNDYCEHEENRWKDKGCGHTWCELCAGYVDTATRVALRSVRTLHV